MENAQKLIAGIVNKIFVTIEQLGLNIVGLIMVRHVQLDIMIIVLLREITQMNVK